MSSGDKWAVRCEPNGDNGVALKASESKDAQFECLRVIMTIDEALAFSTALVVAANAAEKLATK